MATDVPITLRDNQTEIRIWAYRDAEGSAFDFTGYEAAIMLRDSNITVTEDDPDANVVQTWSTGDGQIAVDSDGIRLETNPPDDYPDPGSYKYDIRLYNGESYVVPQSGKCKIIAGVTTA